MARSDRKKDGPLPLPVGALALLAKELPAVFFDTRQSGLTLFPSRRHTIGTGAAARARPRPLRSKIDEALQVDTKLSVLFINVARWGPLATLCKLISVLMHVVIAA